MLGRYENQRFGPGDWVRLDGREYVNCVFDRGCTVEFRGEGGGGAASGCTFVEGWHFVVAGFASAVLQRLGIIVRGPDRIQARLVRRILRLTSEGKDALPFIRRLSDPLAADPRMPELMESLRNCGRPSFGSHLKNLFAEIQADVVPRLQAPDPGDSMRNVTGVRIQMREMRAPLYKYGKAEHVDRLVSHGAFFVNTIQTIRRAEESGSKWGDAREGMCIVTSEISAVNSSLSQTQWVDDALIYCLSTELSADLMQYFEYDACVEIGEPSLLLDALTANVASKVSIGAFAAVRYGPKEFDRASLADNPILYLKDPRFEREREVRAAWQARPGVALMPHEILIPSARRYMRRVI